MKIISKTIQVDTKGEDDMIDITEEISLSVRSSKVQDGIVTIFVVGSTAAVTTIEYELGLRQDFPRMLGRVAPKNIEYEHQKMWHDGNGHSHVRASLVGPSLTVPLKDGSMTLGTWQQIVIVEMDIRHRQREIVLQIIGE
ncbi:MAG: secondary thiamine-phosphate synthase enzyme YjbQ [Thaumarchaeota archaeon]|nr:secondary thiamine-phosphate synthase enzyme YjbQ [Nitrososphaerota archaeon]